MKKAPSIREIRAAAKPFSGVLSMNEPLNLPDEMPLRDMLPGVWPTVGELRKLIAAIKGPPV